MKRQAARSGGALILTGNGKIIIIIIIITHRMKINESIMTRFHKRHPKTKSRMLHYVQSEGKDQLYTHSMGVAGHQTKTYLDK